MAKFKIGEVVEFYMRKEYTLPDLRDFFLARSGEDVVITAYVDWNVCKWQIKFSNGELANAHESELRKKKPPKDEGAREWFYNLPVMKKKEWETV